MRTLAVSAVKSNNSYVNFAGKNKKSAKRSAVGFTVGTLAVATAGVAAYKNRFALMQMGENIRTAVINFKLDLNSKFMHLNLLKWFQG